MNGAKIYDAIKAIASGMPAGSPFELNEPDMEALRSLQPAELEARGVLPEAAKGICTALRNRDAGPLGDQLGLRLTAGQDAPQLNRRIAERGDELYQKTVRPQVEEGNRGKCLALDIGSGDYSIGKTALEAATAVLARRPYAVNWLVRIGYPALRKFGPRFKRARA